LVELPELMELSTGAGATVALVDGPIALDHPGLATVGIRFLNERSSGVCHQYDSVACVHGTVIAGLLHATRADAARGICPGAMLAVRQIFPESTTVVRGDGLPSATPGEVASAIHEVIDHGADIINLSVGLTMSSNRGDRVLEQALDRAARHDVIVVAAAGNEGQLGSSIITRHSWVVPVVACDHDGQILASSNLCTSIGRRGLVAPGHNVVSLDARGGHAKYSGSSVAAAFVTGTFALLRAAFASANATDLRFAVLGNSAGRRSVSPPLLNAWTAYRALKLITLRN